MKHKIFRRFLSIALVLTLLVSMSVFAFSTNALDTSNIVGKVYDWNFKGENGEAAFAEFAGVAQALSNTSDGTAAGTPLNTSFDDNFKWDAEKGLTYTSTGEGYTYGNPEVPSVVGSRNNAAAMLLFSAPDEYKTISDFEVVANRNEDGTFPGIVFLSNSSWGDRYVVRASDTEEANHGIVFEKVWAGRVRVDGLDVLEAKTFGKGDNAVTHDPANFALGAQKVKYQVSSYASTYHIWNNTHKYYYQSVKMTSYDEDGRIIAMYDFTFYDDPNTNACADVFGTGAMAWGWAGTPGEQMAGIYYTNEDAAKIENASIDSIRLIYTDGTSEGACQHPIDSQVIDNEIASTTKNYGYSGDTYCGDCGMFLHTGELIPSTKCDHEHTRIIDKKDAVSCGEPGYTGDAVCDDCDQVIIKGEPITIPHTFDDNWKSIDKKQHARTCSICGNVETAAHTWNGGVVTKKATCAEYGEKTYTCTVCGATKAETIAKTAHSWDKGKITKEPTGTEYGEKTFTCNVCGKNKVDLIPPLVQRTAVFSVIPSASTAKAGDEITFTVNMSDAPVCSSMGLEFTYDKDVFEYVSYSWHMKSTVIENYDKINDFAAWAANKDLDGNGDIFTLVLKVKDTAKVGDATVTLKPAVKDDSDTAMDPGFDVNTVDTIINVFCKHSYSKWTDVDKNKHSRTCKVCGNVETAAHTWNGGVVTKKATCTEYGEKTYTCTVCGVTKAETVAKTAHSWDEGKITKEPTCTDDGEKTFTCKVCGENKVETIDKSKSHISDGGKLVRKPTYKQSGYIEEERCKLCGAIISQGRTIDKLNASVKFRYVVEGINGASSAVNSGKVTVKVYFDVNKDARDKEEYNSDVLAEMHNVLLGMSYDKNVFELTDVEFVKAFGKGAFTELATANADGYVKVFQDVGEDEPHEFRGNDNLFATLTFNVKADAKADDYEIECNVTARRDDVNAVNTAESEKSAEVNVVKLGDANGDGEIDGIDIYLTSRFLRDGEPGAYRAEYDLNKDGKVNGYDLVLLRNAVVGNNEYLYIVAD